MSSLASEQRRSWLLQHLQSARSVSTVEAASVLGVSEMTVRRELTTMEDTGIVRRVRGGAVYSGPISFETRDRSFTKEKDVIAAKLLPLIPPRGYVAFDSSTTMHRLAQMITDCDDLVVVTNGLLTWHALLDRPGVRVILTGGAADRRSDSLVGPVAMACVEGMRFLAYFMSTAAIDETTCYDETLEEAQVKAAFARSSARIFTGAHAAKLGAVATAAAVPLTRVEVLATELDPSDPRLTNYQNAVVEVR